MVCQLEQINLSVSKQLVFFDILKIEANTQNAKPNYMDDFTFI